MPDPRSPRLGGPLGGPPQKPSPGLGPGLVYKDLAFAQQQPRPPARRFWESSDSSAPTSENASEAEADAKEDEVEELEETDAVEPSELAGSSGAPSEADTKARDSWSEPVEQLRDLVEHQGLALSQRMDELLEKQADVLKLLSSSLPPPPPPPESEGGKALLESQPTRILDSATFSLWPSISDETVQRHNEAAKAREALEEQSEPAGILARAYSRRATNLAARKTRSRRASSSTSCSVVGPKKSFDERPSMASRLSEVTLGSAAKKRWEQKLMTKGFVFDCFASALILVNALVMGAEAEYATYHGGQGHANFLFAQIIFNVWFTLELVIRVLLDHCRFLTSADWRWNLFDALLVGFSLADLVQIFQVGFAKSVSSTGRLMRIIRLARVVRLMRLCRSLSHVHQFRKMVYCLQASLSTLFWALLLLLTVMYAFAVLFVQGVAERSGEGDELLQQGYGTLLSAVSTLYKAITGGQSWDVLMSPLGEVDSTFEVLFITYISIVFFGVLNVVTAVFVESAMDSAAHYKDLRIFESQKAKEALVGHMKQVFNQIDVDGSGAISYQEIDDFLHDPQLRMYVESLEVTVEDTAMLFQLMDLDDSGSVDIDEFCTGLLRLQGDARSFDVHLLIFEMAKMQSKWDGFVAYVGLKFDEVVSALSSEMVCGSRTTEKPSDDGRGLSLR